MVKFIQNMCPNSSSRVHDFNKIEPTGGDTSTQVPDFLAKWVWRKRFLKKKPRKVQ